MIASACQRAAPCEILANIAGDGGTFHHMLQVSITMESHDVVESHRLLPELTLDENGR
jgi:hypothetical protein